jgi:hexosaminidase
VAGRPETYAFVEDVIREGGRADARPYLHIGGDEADATPPADYRHVHHQGVCPWSPGTASRRSAGTRSPPVDLPETRSRSSGGSSRERRLWPAPPRTGNKVIMSPADRVYLDMKYDVDSRPGQDWAGYVEVRRAYDWDPAGPAAGRRRGALLGVEAALWSETLRSMTDVQR